MIEIKIGSAERSMSSLEDLDEGWIIQQIQRRRAEGERVCVRVSVHVENINMGLSTPTCSCIGGGGRPPNNREREIFTLWESLGLNRNDFDAGAVVLFLKKLRRHL